MKTFKIGNDRSFSLDAKNNKITIRDKGTKKAAQFTPERWSAFLACRHQIANQLVRLTAGENVAYCMHYGGAWDVSLTNGFLGTTYEISTCRSGRNYGDPPRRGSHYDSTSGRR